MSASMNLVLIIGNIVRDLELKYINSGDAVVDMSIACNESYKDKNGEKKESVEYVDVQVWGRTAENCAQYLAKGSPCAVEGKISTRSWDDKEGNKRYKTFVKARRVQFLGQKEKSQDQDVPF